mgnify:CR=1 FL=1
MRNRLAIAVILSMHSLLSVKCALTWLRWCYALLPTAAILPVPLLLTVASWILFTRVTGIASPSVQDFSRDRRLIGMSWGGSLALFWLMTLQGADGTLGRWLTVSLWTFCTTSCCVVCGRLLHMSGVRELISRPWKMRLLACSLGVVVCGVLIAGLEFTSGMLLSRGKPAEVKQYEGTYLEPDALFRYDDDLGSAMHADRRVSCRLLVNGRVIWDVHYSTDRFGRRQTTCPGNVVSQHNAVFFGCSFLFGEGSEDHQTIPSVFSELSRSCKAVNYGVPGWGDRKSTRLNSSHTVISYAVFCLKKKIH